MKTCKRCGISKELDLFPKNVMTKDRRGSWCKECASKRNKERYLERLREDKEIKKEEVTTETIKRDSVVEWLRDKLEKCDDRGKVEVFIKAHKDEIQSNSDLYSLAKDKLKES